MNKVILEHREMYPKWELKDVFKLIYQNEFGCGHLVSNFEKCTNMLEDEIKGLKKIDNCLFEKIGNGYSRMNLSAAISENIPIEVISHVFYSSAKRQTGTVKGFFEKIEGLKALCEKSELPFSLTEIDDFVSKWQNSGCPLFSHSETYKFFYSPSYRVILEKYEKLPQIIKCVLDKAKQGKVVIGIDGRCGAGKTTLAASLEEIFDCNVIRMDDFFLPPELRTKARLLEPGGNIHYERFEREVVENIRLQNDFEYSVFDCSSMTMNKIKKISQKRITVIEGSYSQHPIFKDFYDIKVFCDVSPEEQKIRIVKRNGVSIYKIFESKWIPLEEHYFSACDIKRNCDFIYS